MPNKFLVFISKVDTIQGSGDSGICGVAIACVLLPCFIREQFSAFCFLYKYFTCFRDLEVLSEKAERKCVKLEEEVAEEEQQHWRNVSKLLQSNQVLTEILHLNNNYFSQS